MILSAGCTLRKIQRCNLYLLFDSARAPDISSLRWNWNSEDIFVAEPRQMIHDDPLLGLDVKLNKEKKSFWLVCRSTICSMHLPNRFPCLTIHGIYYKQKR